MITSICVRHCKATICRITTKQLSIDLSEPTKCEKAGIHIKYNGIGEYECEECRFKMYDDYGKVRNYLEQHPGATATEVSEMVGVTNQKIRRLLKDDKIQIAPGSATFIYCEKCGTGILPEDSAQALLKICAI